MALHTLVPTDFIVFQAPVKNPCTPLIPAFIAPHKAVAALLIAFHTAIATALIAFQIAEKNGAKGLNMALSIATLTIIFATI